MDGGVEGFSAGFEHITFIVQFIPIVSSASTQHHQGLDPRGWDPRNAVIQVFCVRFLLIDMK